MRRLKCVFAATLLAAAVTTLSCRPREKVRVEPTEEKLALASTVHMADPRTAAQLVRGFHDIEQNSWRWSMGKFAVTLMPPARSPERGAQVVVQLVVPDAVVQKLGTVRLTARLQGNELGSASYSAPGEYTFRAEIPRAPLGDEAVTLDFELDKFLAAGVVDQRELGVIVSSVGLEAK